MLLAIVPDPKVQIIEQIINEAQHLWWHWVLIKVLERLLSKRYTILTKIKYSTLVTSSTSLSVLSSIRY